VHRRQTHVGASPPRIRLRSRAGVLLDLPFPPASMPWAATLRPDLRAPGGWSRSSWAPSSPWGWVLPEHLALGDVVEFGGGSSTVDQRWWGLVETYEPDAWLSLIGPLATADDAHALSQSLLQDEAPPHLHLTKTQAGRCHDLPPVARTPIV
jgi:hypothetical protein